MKITRKMFSGGNTAALSEAIRGIAIDHARMAIEPIKDQLDPGLTVSAGSGWKLEHSAPVGGSVEGADAVARWAGEAAGALQSLAHHINLAAATLGIEELQGARKATDAWPSATLIEGGEMAGPSVSFAVSVGIAMQNVAWKMNEVLTALDYPTVHGRAYDKAKIDPDALGLTEKYASTLTKNEPVDEASLMQFAQVQAQNFATLLEHWGQITNKPAPKWEVMNPPTDWKDPSTLDLSEPEAVEVATDSLDPVVHDIAAEDYLHKLLNQTALRLNYVADHNGTPCGVERPAVEPAEELTLYQDPLPLTLSNEEVVMPTGWAHLKHVADRVREQFDVVNYMRMMNNEPPIQIIEPDGSYPAVTTGKSLVDYHRELGVAVFYLCMSIEKLPLAEHDKIVDRGLRVIAG
jgi:hypothetical protein